MPESELPLGMSDSEPEFDAALLGLTSTVLAEALGQSSGDSYLSPASTATPADSTPTADTAPAVSLALGLSEPSFVTGHAPVYSPTGPHTPGPTAHPAQPTELVDFEQFPELACAESYPFDELSVTALSAPTGALGAHHMQQRQAQAHASHHVQQNMPMPMLAEALAEPIPQEALFASAAEMSQTAPHPQHGQFGIPMPPRTMESANTLLGAPAGGFPPQWRVQGLVPSARSESGLRRVSGWAGPSRIIKRRTRGPGSGSVVVAENENTCCPHCGTDCLTKAAKKNHMRKFHPKPKVFACLEKSCNTRFSAKCNLSKHFRSVHMKVRPYSCAQCSSTFSERNKLVKHTDTVHGGARPFSCNHDGCTKTFGQKSDRTRHIAVVHLGHRRYKCGDCAKNFGRKSSLAQHVMRIHRRTKEQAAEVMAAAIGADPDSNDGITVYPARIMAMAEGA